MSSFSEEVRHPSGALDPPQGGLSWYWLLIGGGILALVLIAIFRPAWLGRIGIHINLSGPGKALGGIANPMEWV